MNISTHISYDKATRSQTATRKRIENIPSGEQVEAMKIVAAECFEKIYTVFPDADVNSFFRSPALNAGIGGSATSQHMKGEAIDITRGSKEKNRELFEWCKLHLIVDQCINEFDYSWIHVSFTVKKQNRKMYFEIK